MEGVILILYQDVILFILSKANQKVFGTFKSRFQHFGLTPMQALVLNALYEKEGISAGEIGKRLILDSATLSGVIDRMTENGWIVKDAAKEDKRVLNIRLTDRARQFQGKFMKETEEINKEVLSIFSAEERLLLVRMLKDLRK